MLGNNCPIHAEKLSHRLLDTPKDSSLMITYTLPYFSGRLYNMNCISLFIILLLIFNPR